MWSFSSSRAPEAAASSSAAQSSSNAAPGTAAEAAAPSSTTAAPSSTTAAPSSTTAATPAAPTEGGGVPAGTTTSSSSFGFFDDFVGMVSNFGKQQSDNISNLYTHASKLGNPNLLSHAGAEKLWRDHFHSEAEAHDTLRFFFFCNLLTSVGPVAGTLFVTDAAISFLSDGELEYNIHPEETATSQYKLSIPINCISGLAPKANPGNEAERFIHITTADGFHFWFTAFISYDQAIGTMLAALHNAAGGLQGLHAPMPTTHVHSQSRPEGVREG